MKAGYKVLAVSAVALGLAFFVFKKPSAGEAGETASTAAGGGLGGLIPTGVKAIGKVVAKLLAPAAGVTAIAGGGMATATIGTVTLAGTNIGLSTGVAAAGNAAVPVTAGAGAVGLGTAAATVGGFAAAAFVVTSFLKQLFSPNWKPQVAAPQSSYPSAVALEERKALKDMSRVEPVAMGGLDDVAAEIGEM